MYETSIPKDNEKEQWQVGGWGKSNAFFRTSPTGLYPLMAPIFVSR